MNGTMTTSDERTRDELFVVSGIAEKLWWGWVPMTGQKRWHIPFEHRHESMTQEEVQWFKRH